MVFTTSMGMHEFDMIIVGTGSGNSIPGPEFDDWKIAIVEKGVFGGTCLNVGCIPSKMFIYAADLALQAGGYTGKPFDSGVQCSCAGHILLTAEYLPQGFYVRGGSGFIQ